MEREELKKKIDEQLQEWHTQFDELKVKAALGKAEAREEIERRLDDLHHQRDDFRRRFDAAGDKGGGTWQTVKEGFERASNEIKKTIDEVREKIKH